MKHCIRVAAGLMLVCGLQVQIPIAASAPSPPAAYYLALGDSYSAGYLDAQRPGDLACSTPASPGPICVFYRDLLRLNPSMKLVNLSDPGADSCELAGDGHHCYDSQPRKHPLQDALKLLSEHPNAVNPISVTIGGNDFLGLLGAAAVDPLGTVARIPSVLAAYRTNLDTILQQLRAAAPQAEIIVSTQPNPFGGIGSPPLPLGLPEIAQGSISALNLIMKTEAPKYGAVIADTAAVFSAYPGGASRLTQVPATLRANDLSQVNIHPTPQGYKIYGDVLFRASGFKSAALSVAIRLSKSTVARGKKETVSGLTGPGTPVQVRIKIPAAGRRTLTTVAMGTGVFTRSFRVGNIAGRGSVRACAVRADGIVTCSTRLVFRVK